MLIAAFGALVLVPLLTVLDPSIALLLLERELLYF